MAGQLRPLSPGRLSPPPVAFSVWGHRGRARQKGRRGRERGSRQACGATPGRGCAGGLSAAGPAAAGAGAGRGGARLSGPLRAAEGRALRPVTSWEGGGGGRWVSLSASRCRLQAGRARGGRSAGQRGRGGSGDGKRQLGGTAAAGLTPLPSPLPGRRKMELG